MMDALDALKRYAAAIARGSPATPPTADQLFTVIAELEALRKKLPKTADGVHVLPWANVYHPDEQGPSTHWNLKEALWCNGGEHVFSECYSTRKAARKMRKAKTP